MKDHNSIDVNHVTPTKKKKATMEVKVWNCVLIQNRALRIQNRMEGNGKNK
jgi:hypothetical protein